MSKFRYVHQFCLGAVMLTVLTAIHASPTSSHHHVPPKSATKVAAQVDINHADVAKLSQVKGIGVKRAQAIIAWRQQHGHFSTVDDLLKVKGFSSKRLKAVRSQLVVNG